MPIENEKPAYYTGGALRSAGGRRRQVPSSIQLSPVKSDPQSHTRHENGSGVAPTGVFLFGILAVLLCGCQMTTTYGRKPTQCPGTESIYALTIYSNTSSEEANDAKAEKVLAKLMKEVGVNNYNPILRIQYNTALKFFYVFELSNTNSPSTTPFSERMKAVPKVFGRHAGYGYAITYLPSGTRYLSLTSWPYPLERAVEENKNLRKSIPGIQLSGIRILTIDGETVILNDLVFSYERVNLRDFVPLVQKSRREEEETQQ